MAEVRKGKAGPVQKSRARVAAAVAKPTSSTSELKRLLLETQDQLSLIHGVLEELCERQEALSAWQMEFSKRLVTLQEAQWRSLEDLAGVDMGNPVEKAFGIQFDGADPAGLDDQLEEAQKLMEQVNSDSMSKRAVRLRKRKSSPRPEFTPEDDPLTGKPEPESLRRETSPESVFVIPEKVDVH
jgi:hypothetical protein